MMKWKFHFMVITISAIVVSAVFSSEFFIKPRYKSFAIIYPSNIIPYSSETPSEQLLQLLESSDIRNAVVNKFKLAAHYDIDTTSKSGLFDLIAAYQANVEVRRTQYNSIEIKVFDTDAQIACDMVTEIINALNLKARNLQREKTKEVLAIVSNQLLVKKKQVDSVNSILQELRVKYQLLDYEVQVKEVTKSYLKALSGGARKESLKDIDALMRNLEEKGGEYYQMKETFDILLESYNTSKLDYDKVMSDLNKILTYSNIVSKPYPADKKSYPIRWVIVAVSVVSTNLLLLLILTIMAKKNKL
ncbi:MAG: hypothetical protein Q7W13_14605 [Bacteroidia bacterium]|nr:hypothetical protein [Bacteroidia bacterium]